MDNVKKRRTQGQAILEFALILPVLLGLIFGIIEVARLFQSYLVITNAARFGMRYAVTGEYDPALCVDADLNGECDDDEENQARILSIYEETKKMMEVGIFMEAEDAANPEKSDVDKDTPGYFNITVCSNRTISDVPFQYVPPSEDFFVNGSNDYCLAPDGLTDQDDAGDPSEGRHRVTVAVTYEHQFEELQLYPKLPF